MSAVAVLTVAIAAHEIVPAVVIALLMGLTDLLVNLWMMPKGGQEPLTRQDVSDKMDQTRRMTKGVFAEEIADVHEAQQGKLDESNRRHGIDRIHRS